MLGMKPFISYISVWHITSLCTYFIRRTVEYNESYIPVTVKALRRLSNESAL